MKIYKENTLCFSKEENLSEIYLLFATYLNLLKDNKTSVHYMKEIIKLKNKEEDYLSILLFKIKLYSVILKISDQKKSQIEILVNIIGNILSRFDNFYIINIIGFFVIENYPRDLIDKIISNDLKNKNNELYLNYQKKFDLTIDLSRIEKIDDFLDEYKKNQLNKNSQNLKEIPILKKIDLKNFLHVLKYSGLIFKNKVYTMEVIAELESYLESYFFDNLFFCPSYMLFLNNLLLHYFESFNEKMLLKIIFSFFDFIEKNDFLNEIKFSQKFCLTIFTKLVTNFFIINGIFKIVDLSSKFKENIIFHLLELNENFSKKNCCNLLKILLKDKIENHDSSKISYIAKRLLFFKEQLDQSAIKNDDIEITQKIVCKIEEKFC